MNRLFQVTVYTGQQLVLEALQRWLQRPCTEPDGQRQRRASIKNLIVLLLKTAATGVLATILDAAIEYRRRQLLSAAEEDPLAIEDGSGASSSSGGTLSSLATSRFGLGPLSRAGIAAWKTRLLIAIDEMERQAHQYGIEPTMRFTPSKLFEDGVEAEEEGTTLAVPEGKLESATAAATAAVAAATDDSDVDNRQAALAATVEQLQQLAKLGGDDAERHFEERVDSLLDSLLGTATDYTMSSVLPTPLSSRLKASSSTLGLTTSTSTTNANATTTDAHGAPSSENGSNCSDQICHICMDRSVGVQVLGCHHDLCFQCARRLCAGQDHAVPQCPFCRQPISGFSSYTPTPTNTPTMTVSVATAQALACI